MTYHFLDTMIQSKYISLYILFIYYRNDGSTLNEITLPTGVPFVLLRYSEVCQSVYAMDVVGLYVDWTTDNDRTTDTDTTSGMYPYDDGQPQHHRLHYCYYSGYVETKVEILG